MGLFSFGGKKEGVEPIKWVQLTSESQLDELIKESNLQPVMFFKHSTRCSISSMALSRLENNWNLTDVTPVYLDLLTYRPISNKLAEVFAVDHQSPQVILVKDGMSVIDLSHSQITVDAIKPYL